jgi:hypothetical protein
MSNVVPFRYSKRKPAAGAAQHAVPALVVKRPYDPLQSLAHFILDHAENTGNKGLKTALILSTDEQLSQGFRLTLADYFRRHAGSPHLSGQASMLLGHAADFLASDAANQDALNLLQKDSKTIYFQAPNRAATALVSTALKTPLYVQDVLADSVMLEHSFNPNSNPRDIRERLTHQFATQTLDKAAPSTRETDHPLYNASLNKVLAFKSQTER